MSKSYCSFENIACPETNLQNYTVSTSTFNHFVLNLHFWSMMWYLKFLLLSQTKVVSPLAPSLFHHGCGLSLCESLTEQCCHIWIDVNKMSLSSDKVIFKKKHEHDWLFSPQGIHRLNLITLKISSTWMIQLLKALLSMWFELFSWRILIF